MDRKRRRLKTAASRKPRQIGKNRQDGDKLLRVMTVKRELQRLIDAVRTKNRALRQNADEMQSSIELQTKPFVVPLQKAVFEGIKGAMPAPIVKRERKESVKTETSDGQNEGDDLNKTMETATQTEKVTSLPEKYLRRLADPAYKDKLDLTYGVRPDGSGGTVIGNSKIAFSKNIIHVRSKTYKVTRGLMELLFMKVPNRIEVTQNDLSAYKNILQLTNGHLQMYSSDKSINSNRGKKYTSVISPLFSSVPQQTAVNTSSTSTDVFTGSGVRGEFTSYNGNVNTLVNRLRLLVLSQSAGHTAHKNEISQIIDALRENGIIA